VATYAELATIRSDDTQWGDFLAKVRVAAAIKATEIIDAATPPEAALSWAKDTIANPTSAGDGIVWYVVGKNDNLALSAIYGASDSAIQSNVDAAVDAIYGS